MTSINTTKRSSFRLVFSGIIAEASGSSEVCLLAGRMRKEALDYFDDPIIAFTLNSIFSSCVYRWTNYIGELWIVMFMKSSLVCSSLRANVPSSNVS